MKLPDESGYGGEYGKRPVIIYSLAGVSFVVLLILIIVVTQNTNTSSRANEQNERNPGTIDSNTDVNIDINDPANDSGVRVDDLDFWDMYPEKDDSALGLDDVVPQVPDDDPRPPLGPSEDGRHTLIERRNGTSEWVMINPYITRNTYDPLGFVLRRERMGYYENDRQVSFMGVDLSRHDGNADFARMKSDGVYFVLLRLGARGYETGQLTVDDNFLSNLNSALESGLHVGISFFSQAVTREEAIEEATLIIETVADKKITYPVVFHMDYIAYGASRIDRLTRAEKTEITDAFCNFVSGAGYVPMIYGTKEWLIEQIDLARLLSYDIWLSQSRDLPDYPYKFQIWQYSHNGTVSGVNGNVNMNISFVDYSAR
ncbi:MAG: glycoside hydrolase family 25 protein [Lachnospiraceae bacterium]|nr:glycoside hydrolase family 25 protein [Lachnospiraceae bacterium]